MPRFRLTGPLLCRKELVRLVVSSILNRSNHAKIMKAFKQKGFVLHSYLVFPYVGIDLSNQYIVLFVSNRSHNIISSFIDTNPSAICTRMPSMLVLFQS